MTRWASALLAEEPMSLRGMAKAGSISFFVPRPEGVKEKWIPER